VIEERLRVREPFDGEALVGFLGTRAIPGLEVVEGSTYRRSLALERGTAVVDLTPDGASVRCGLELEDRRDLEAAVDACRRLLDLDADPAAVAARLGGDPLLGPLVAALPGLRVPGAVDGAELAVRAVLGQQVSLAAARTAAGRLAAEHGEPVARPQGGVVRLFPSAGTLARLDPARLPMPRSRARALVGLCRALADGGLRLDPAADRDEARRGLLALPGIGPWTVGYVAMRALGDPDVFLVEDLGVRHGLARLGGPSDPRDARALGEAWAPWRSYASQYLWQAPHSASTKANSST
jgi:AraC family transcriptional regulator of adaptative response / DNA-3-methyladenine glycosylase II